MVYDEVLVDHSDSVSDRTLLTLRMQLDSVEEADSHCRVTWENVDSTDDAELYVVWQQAWGGTSAGGSYPLAGGLANAGFVRTEGNTVQQKTYPWAVNALSVKAAGRFQLPLLDTNPDNHDAENMGWKSAVTPNDYDLQSGELYFDSWQKAVLAYQSEAGWTAVWQPERTAIITGNTTWVTGDEKNLVYSGSSSITVTLDTTLADIAVGTTVRIAYHVSGTPLAAVSVSCGQPANVVIGPNTGRTFVFYKDGSNGRWLVC